ncbi:phosphatase PAP2 family protein [Mesorhizobium sp. SB112]|uniref:phosphatase PAP2 family protein n=1 Tax=Mesorhizobium sp. SB112 TaxID=3151853 RepID=UPI00326330E9
MEKFRILSGKIEFPVLLACLIIALGVWGFVELIDVARETTPHSFDTEILLAFRTPGQPDNPIGPFWMEEAVRDITSLGSVSVLLVITLSTIFYLLIQRKFAASLFIAVAVIGGQLLSSLLKLGVDRPRPDLVPKLMEVHTLSFPSGHAMLSAVIYITLGSQLANLMPDRMSKIYVLSVALLVTVMVGISRIYLGVHWPSDVLAGWCAGLAWAMLCWLIARYLIGQKPGSHKNTKG